MPTRVKVLVDSSAGISAELATKWGVGVVPLYVTWGERTYRDGLDLMPDDFYLLLARNETIPKTSAPNPEDFVAACTEVLAGGYEHVLIVTVSAHMSAAYDHACIAAHKMPSNSVVVLDSRQGAGAQALIAARSARAAKSSAALRDVVAEADRACGLTGLLMVVNTLKYLRRGGRISGAQAMMGEIIQLKPILSFVDGRLKVIEKPRTMRQATRRLLDHLTNGDKQVEQVLVMYADTPEAAAELATLIREQRPGTEVDVSPVSAVVGAHAGPGLLGVAMLWRETAPTEDA